MNYQTILGKNDFIEYLRGKKASFLLAGSVSKTCEINGLSQAGIPGMMNLTPTLDAEFITTAQVRSLEDVPKTLKGVPTPALITRAVHELKPFADIEILNLGLTHVPQINYFDVHNFDIKPSDSIKTGANINAMEVFQKGVEFGQNFKTSNDYVILGESVPSGTTTANATALALGYDCKDSFSSSYKNSPNSLKAEVITQALETSKNSVDIFEKLGSVGDNMIIFNAGFILGSRANNLKLILAGGTQMACVLLTVNSILRSMGGELDSSNLALCTTKWINEDKNSDIKALLELLDFPINAYSANFDFSSSQNPLLKLYDEGEAKEGVGAGGALVYGLINGLNNETIVKKVESFLGA